MDSESEGTIVVPNYVISIEDLLNSAQSIQRKEEADKTLLQTIPDIPTEYILPKLYDWSSKGCPKNFVIKTLTIESPPTCTDGLSRRFVDYIHYLSKDFTLDDLVKRLSLRMPGMSFSYSFNTTTIDINVSKQTE
jgi:hypothetical protein